MTQQEAKDKFLGKMVRAKFRNSWVVGRCEFIGINEFLGWTQVTIQRLPVQLKSFDEVELLTGEYDKVHYVNGV